MGCEFRDLLGPLLDGELAAAEQQRITQHLSGCAACRQELRALKQLAARLAPNDELPPPPAELWAGIESSLRSRRSLWARLPRRPVAIAAGLLLAIGVGLIGLPWIRNGVAPAEAGTIDFTVLLNSVALDPARAFADFLTRYAGHPVEPDEARRYAAGLNFDLPERLPGGFQREQVYAIQLGANRGLAVRYARGNELLIAIFHPPVLREHYGTHEDYECIVGQHRGHMTEIDGWRLVHVTDPTTCHCILSRLDPENELPPLIALLAPGTPVEQAMPPRRGHR